MLVVLALGMGRAVYTARTREVAPISVTVLAVSALEAAREERKEGRNAIRRSIL